MPYSTLEPIVYYEFACTSAAARHETRLRVHTTARLFVLTLLLLIAPAWAIGAEGVSAQIPHPDTAATGWADLFEADLSNAEFVPGVWSFDEGVLTATEDQVIWTSEDFENFTIDLEFKTAPGTNSGIIVYATDQNNWIPNSVEIQITDDFHPKWAGSPKTWQCAAIFGHLAAVESRVKPTGQWNHMTASCVGTRIRVALNGKLVTDMDMNLWTSAKKNPDGSDIPAWLSRPFSELETKGRIGLQGKHGDAPIYFRNMRIVRH